MKGLVAILISLCAVSGSQGAVPTDPDYSLLWGSFRCVLVVDSFLIGTTDDGLALALADPTTGQYAQIDHLFLNSAPTQLKRFGNMLMVRTKSDVLYVINIGDLPTLTLAGQIDIGVPYTDFALHGQSLYCAMGFEGVRRYRLTQYAHPQAADSDFSAIHAIQVECRADTLYVLDDYNGILRYDVSGADFGELRDVVWIPFQASRFCITDTTILIGLAARKELLLVRPDFSADTIALSIAPRVILTIDSLVVAIDPAAPVMDIVSRKDRHVTHAPVESSFNASGQPDMFAAGTSIVLLYSDYRGFLQHLALDQIYISTTPKPAYAGPQTITDLEFFDNRLYVSQIGRPVEIYAVGPTGEPELDTSLFVPLKSATSLDNSMGRLLCFFPTVGAIFLSRYQFDSLFLDNYLDVDTTKVKGFAANQFSVNDKYTVLTWGGTRATLYSLSDTLLIEPLANIIVQGIITAAVCAREWVAVATNKGQLYIYRRNSNDGLENKATWGVARNVTSLVYDDVTKYLYALSGDRVATVDLSAADVPIHTELPPLDIRQVAFGSDRMYSIGDEGIGIFERPAPGDDQLPLLLDRGGRAGTMLVAVNDLLFTSGGHTLNVYDLRIPTETNDHSSSLPSQIVLAPNYPNPFNPSTTIDYVLPSDGTVSLSILNLLGQEVARLVDGPQTAGAHTSFWHGMDQFSRPVATGIYFYRLESGGQAVTRKMLLLK